MDTQNIMGIVIMFAVVVAAVFFADWLKTKIAE